MTDLNEQIDAAVSDWARTLPKDPPEGPGVPDSREALQERVEELTETRANSVPSVLYDNLKQLRDEARAEVRVLQERIRKALELCDEADRKPIAWGYGQIRSSLVRDVLSKSDDNGDEIKFEAVTLSKADIEGMYAVVDAPYREDVDLGPLDDEDVPATNTEEGESNS